MDSTTGIIIAVALVAAGVAFVVWLVRREKASHSERLYADKERTKKREAAMAELDPQGRLLYQLLERQDDLKDEMRRQTRHLGDIKSATVLIAVLLVLSAIGGCLFALLGGSILGL